MLKVSPARLRGEARDPRSEREHLVFEASGEVTDVDVRRGDPRRQALNEGPEASPLRQERARRGEEAIRPPATRREASARRDARDAERRAERRKMSAEGARCDLAPPQPRVERFEREGEERAEEQPDADGHGEAHEEGRGDERESTERPPLMHLLRSDDLDRSRSWDGGGADGGKCSSLGTSLLRARCQDGARRGAR